MSTQLKPVQPDTRFCRSCYGDSFRTIAKDDDGDGSMEVWLCDRDKQRYAEWKGEGEEGDDRKSGADCND